MNALQIFLTLLLIRLVIPFGILILIGESLRRREDKYWFHV